MMTLVPKAGEGGGRGTGVGVVGREGEMKNGGAQWKKNCKILPGNGEVGPKGWTLNMCTSRREQQARKIAFDECKSRVAEQQDTGLLQVWITSCNNPNNPNLITLDPNDPKITLITLRPI